MPHATEASNYAVYATVASLFNSGGALGMSDGTGILVAFKLESPATQGFSMARWPRHVWTSAFTYGTVFVIFPMLCLLAYAWVRQWIF